MHWKNGWGNVVSFRSRTNQHITDCKTSTSTGKFPKHVCHCAMNNECLKEPYFQLNIMMKLKNSRQLEFYENTFYEKGYDTINCPEYLKKYLNLLSWVYLVNVTNLFFPVEKLHSQEQMQKALV